MQELTMESITTRSVVAMKSREPKSVPSIVHGVPPRSVLHGVRVLLLAPQADYRQDVTAALRLRGAAVSTAGSVEEALKALVVFGPDVLVVDIELPGYELESLHEQVHRLEVRQGRRIPEVAMTPAAMLQARQRAREAGFKLHVSRPVEPGRLAAAIVHLVPQPRLTADPSTAALHS
jgi:CheY-like chemotaxis protein